MLTFLKKVRKSLIDSGSSQKYLLYAIGEIALVVIGILIALQINNWNEWRKDIQYEAKVLDQLTKSLQRDLSTFEMLMGRTRIKEEGINETLNYLASELVFEESLFFGLYGQAGLGINYSYDQGVYESLKSNGLERIRDDSLRAEIIHHYESRLPRYEWFIDGQDEIHVEETRRLEERFLKYDFTRDDNQEWSGRPVLKSVDLFNDENFQKVIWMEERLAYDYRRRLDALFRSTNALIQHVETITRE